MKKYFKQILFIFLALIVFPSNSKAWDPIGSGSGMSPGSSSSCQSAQGCCFCRWNNANYGAVQFTIVYYDGSYRHKLGREVGYYKSDIYKNNPNSLNWVEQRLKGIKEKNWLPYGSLYPSDYYEKLKQVLLSDAQKKAGYPRIKEIFGDAGVNYDNLLQAAKERGNFTDTTNGRTYNNVINEKIGSKGTATKGIRLIVEPIVTIESTGFCPSFSSIMDKAYTIKNLFTYAYGKTDGSYKYLNNNTFTDFAKLMYVEKGDIGYQPVSTGNLDLGYVSNPNSGWGLNIYGPFDDVDPKCNPDKEYAGYKSGVEYCCKTEKITVENTTNNDKCKNGSKDCNLTRPLTDYEIKSTCNKDLLKCDPDKDGVDTCCQECNVTFETLQNNVAGSCLTKPIDLKDLENSSCNKGGQTGNCSYALDAKTPNTCTPDTDGKIYDIANWNCVFRSTQVKEVKDHYFDNDSNRYCAIYCKEEVDYGLPKPGLEVYSGRYLLVGEIEASLPVIDPINYKGKKTCRITQTKGSTAGSINRVRFENDLIKADNEIATKWDEWKIWQAKQQACDADVKTGAGTHTHGDYPNVQTYNHTEYSGGSSTYNGVRYTCGYSSGHCMSKPNYSSQIASAKAKYEDAVRTRQKYIDQINACTDYALSRTYKFDPVVAIEYDEPTYGFYADKTKKQWTLEKESSLESTNTTYYSNGSASNDSGNASSSFNYLQKYMYKCTGNTPCTKSEIYKYPDVSWWETTINKDIKYVLPEGTYQYISKSTGQAFDSKTQAGGENSVDMERSILPIHYSTMPGKIDFRLITKSLGAGNKFNKYVIEGNKFNGVQYGNISKYTCSFIVKCQEHIITPDVGKYCEICAEQVDTCGKGTCDPSVTECLPCKPGDPDCKPCDPSKQDCGPCKGESCKGGSTDIDINLIFRSISMFDKTRAFPGIDGEGREPGKNWPDDTIDGIIVNNRGVKNYEVYKQSPMYEITLTPTLMKEIRKYNKARNSELVTIYDGPTPKTGLAGYADYASMKCQGNGTKCVSRAIRDWKVKGCAVKEEFSTSDFPKCTTSDNRWGL